MRIIAPYLFGLILAATIFYGLATVFGVGPQAVDIMTRLADSALDFGQNILSGLWDLLARGV